MNEKFLKTPEGKFVALIAKLKPLEIVGAAKLMDVGTDSIKDAMLKNNWEDIVVEMTQNFSKKNRKQRREIMKFLKHVATEDENDGVATEENLPQE